MNEEIKNTMTSKHDLLSIPEFLCRKPKRGRPRKIKRTEPVTPENKWDEWDIIKQEKYGARYDIKLGDEAPRIGSGTRTVYVKEGRKWAHMTRHCGDPEDRTHVIRKRFSLKRWLDLKDSNERYKARQERAIKKLREVTNETNS